MSFIDDTSMDPGTSLEMVTETCVAHFLGGPLNGVRDPAFIWNDAYLNEGAMYLWGDWEDQDGEAVLVGSHRYDITVNQHKAEEGRLITCKYAGFSDEGC